MFVYQTAAQPHPSGQKMANTFIQAMKVDDTELRTLLGSAGEGAPMSDFEVQTRAVMQPFVDANSGIVATNQLGAITNLVARTAAILYANRGTTGLETPQDAVNYVFENAFENFYDIQGTYYVPKYTEDGQPYNYKAANVALRGMLENRDFIESQYFDNVTITNFIDGSDSQIKITSDHVLDYGFWSTSADGQGVELWIHAGATPVPVNKNGDQYFLSWEDLTRFPLTSQRVPASSFPAALTQEVPTEEVITRDFDEIYRRGVEVPPSPREDRR
jgi:hypothetical protein